MYLTVSAKLTVGNYRVLSHDGNVEAMCGESAVIAGGSPIRWQL